MVLTEPIACQIVWGNTSSRVLHDAGTSSLGPKRAPQPIRFRPGHR